MELSEVVTRLREGQQAMAPVFVSLLAPTLYGYAAVVAPDLGDADRELVCERAVERAASKIDKYDPETGPITRWVLPFVRHAAQDVRRNNGVGLPLDDQVDVSAPAPPPTTMSAETADALLATLTDTDRLLLALRYTERLTFAEIATALGGGVTEAAVRQRHTRLLRSLRASADDLLEGTPR